MMKKICILVISMALAMPLFSQQQKNVIRKNNYEADYLQLSNKQKSLASVMLGGGILMIVAPALILLNSELGDENLSRKTVITLTVMAAGGLSVLGSIPLFIASGRNKKRALSVSTRFKMSNHPVITSSAFIRKSYPSLAIVLNL